MEPRPHKVLLLVETANPEWPSVPLEGWSLSQALGRLTSAHIVTQVRNRDAFLRAGLVEGRDFTVIENEYAAKPLYRISSLLRGGTGIGWTTVMAFTSIAYYAFEYEVWRKFGARLRSGEFDLVHRITPISPTSQSLISKRLHQIGIPFVIGPLNGGVPWPKGFIRRQFAEKEWLASIRSIYKLMPYYSATRRYSSLIIVGSRDTLKQVPDWAKSKCVYVHENGVDMTRFTTVRNRRASLPLRGAFVGRLVPYKGADMLLTAIERFIADGSLTLDIIGDGPQRPQLEALVAEKNLGGRVTFHGWVEHKKIQHVLGKCDFLALPSIREFGGAVVLEAMALGVAPVVADYGGPSELVDSETGVRIPFHDQASLIAGFARAVGEFIKTPQRLDSFGQAARKRVLAEFTWDAKAKKIVNFYDKLIM